MCPGISHPDMVAHRRRLKVEATYRAGNKRKHVSKLTEQIMEFMPRGWSSFSLGAVLLSDSTGGGGARAGSSAMRAHVVELLLRRSARVGRGNLPTSAERISPLVGSSAQAEPQSLHGDRGCRPLGAKGLGAHERRLRTSLRPGRAERWAGARRAQTSAHPGPSLSPRLFPPVSHPARPLPSKPHRARRRPPERRPRRQRRPRRVPWTRHRHPPPPDRSPHGRARIAATWSGACAGKSRLRSGR